MLLKLFLLPFYLIYWIIAIPIKILWWCFKASIKVTLVCCIGILVLLLIII